MNESYGEVILAGGAWTVRCEPFVRTRLKRVFPRAPQHAAETIAISASAENSRDLLWFLERYPMKVTAQDTLARLAAEHEDTEVRLANLLTGHVPPPTGDLAIPAREYQSFAAAMLDVREGYLLADDLGLGKTVSAICAMCRPDRLPALVVCPAHLPCQWEMMLKRFAPHLHTHVLRKGSVYDLTTPTRKSKQGDLLPSRFPDVIITSYHKLRGWAETLAGVVRLVVFDECQALRRSGTGIHHAARLVASRASRRMGLSATPIHNYGNEFHHVIDVLAPGSLGTYHEFLREWCTPIPNGRARINETTEFGAYLRREGIMLRRTRKDVQRELPQLTRIVHEIDADPAVFHALDGDAITLARIVLGESERYRGEKMQAASEFDSLLRQATGLAKAPYVAQFVDLLLDSGEPLVLFGWHRGVYEIWMDLLSHHAPMLYTGSESPKQKAQAIEAFVGGSTNLLIMSLRSGAGVDGLQARCRTTVHGELDWSPMVHEQCMGRVHRDGQEGPCVAYFLPSEFGSDPMVAEILGIKREQSEGVRNPGGPLAQPVDTGEGHIQRLAHHFLARRGLLAGPKPRDRGRSGTPACAPIAHAAAIGRHSHAE